VKNMLLQRSALD